MAIIDDVTTQMKDAMRAKDKVRLGTLRSIRAAFIEALKADGSENFARRTMHHNYSPAGETAQREHHSR